MKLFDFILGRFEEKTKEVALSFVVAVLLVSLFFSWYGTKKTQERKDWVAISREWIRAKGKGKIGDFHALRSSLVEHPELCYSFAEYFPEEPIVTASLTAGNPTPYSLVTRLISQGYYQEAFERALVLDRELTQDPFLRGLNQLRLVALAEEICPDKKAEFIFQAQELWKSYPEVKQKLSSYYHIGAVRLDDYITYLGGSSSSEEHSEEGQVSL